MRVIGLDVGERRIGVALTDPLDITAQGVETIQVQGRAKDAERVLELCRQYETDRVLCGLPLNMDGTAGFQSEHVRKFAKTLEDLGLQVRFQDERLTTKLATGALLQADVRRDKRKKVVDKIAATYILQSFMDAGGWREIKQKPKPEGVWLMSNQDFNNDDMNMEVDPEAIVELVDEDGNNVRFEHIMTLEHNGKNYICLLPLDEMEDVEEDELILMRIETDENGEDYYSTIDDETELNEVYDKYLEIAEADEGEEE